LRYAFSVDALSVLAFLTAVNNGKRENGKRENGKRTTQRVIKEKDPSIARVFLLGMSEA
jgi:hypothetical protein